LKFIGKWTDWLLDTDSLPLVIIVGLVGFSLLGATVSRVVRAGTGAGFAGFSASDLLMVVAGGVAAAMVVFLASYGGLAVIGDSRTDPDPYVVFIACLIGAVFSEDVWNAARTRFQDRLLHCCDQTISPAPTNQSLAAIGKLPADGHLFPRAIFPYKAGLIRNLRDSRPGRSRRAGVSFEPR
jgi:hypothetical protein